MAHVEEHVEQMYLWPTTSPCGTEVEDANSLRRYLSDVYGLWKAEWKMFDRKRAPEESEKPVDPASTSDSENTRETRPYKKKKLAKTGDKFIECCLRRWP